MIQILTRRLSRRIILITMATSIRLKATSRWSDHLHDWVLHAVYPDECSVDKYNTPDQEEAAINQEGMGDLEIEGEEVL